MIQSNNYGMFQSVDAVKSPNRIPEITKEPPDVAIMSWSRICYYNLRTVQPLRGGLVFDVCKPH